MTLRLKLAACLFSALLGVSFVHAAPADNQVENIIVKESPDGITATVVLESVKPLKYAVREVSDPPQIVIDLKGTVLYGRRPMQQFGQSFIKNVEYFYQADPGGSPVKLLKSVSILLHEKADYSVSQKDWILSVALTKRSGAKDASGSGGVAVPVTPLVLPEEDGGRMQEVFQTPRSNLSENPTADEFVQVGLTNHKPLEIALNEHKYAKRKLFEARRNFFPAVSGKGTQSKGTIQSDPNDPNTRADFNRREVGVELGQPLFQSGRIYYAEKQAKAQRDVAELQIERITRETTFEVLKALYAYISAREAYILRKGMQERSVQVVEITEKKNEIGLTSRSEYLGVLSGANQMEYKAVSQEKDMEIAKIKLLGVLNLESLPEQSQIRLEESVLPQLPEMKVDQAVALALANRPEIKIAKLTLEGKMYGRKVARAEYLFKVDLSGFVGKSGAAFRSEPINMKDSYNLGVKGVLYFGGSSINPLVSKERTAPDLGSTSRTETDAETVTVGVLDSLGASSNLLQAKIDEEKSAEDLRKGKKDILVETKEAFFNYQKAKVQIESSRNELQYRKKEAAIADAKEKVHQIEAPQALSAKGSVVDAEIGYKEAISFYLTSVAALEKAVGGKLTRTK